MELAPVCRYHLWSQPLEGPVSVSRDRTFKSKSGLCFVVDLVDVLSLRARHVAGEPSRRIAQELSLLSHVVMELGSVSRKGRLAAVQKGVLRKVGDALKHQRKFTLYQACIMIRAEA